MNPLIGVTALAGELAGPVLPVLLDVRWRLGGPPGIDSYRAGHLPSAVFTDLDRDLARPPGPGGRHPLPADGLSEAAMRRAGVSDGRPVVAYDDGDAVAGWPGLVAAALLRARRRPGPGRRAACLAGGRPAADHGRAAPDPGDFTARPGQMPLLDAAGAAEIARSGKLLDARTAERYRGESEPVNPVAGHIPGALSAPAAANLAAGGGFLGPDGLRERFSALGVTAGGPVGTYCGSGVSAAQERARAGGRGRAGGAVRGVLVGLGSDPARPVAAGPDPG